MIQSLLSINNGRALNVTGSAVKAAFTHQGVIKADVSLQTALSVFKLNNRHFSCCDRQDVPQTCDVEKTVRFSPQHMDMR